MNVAEYTNLINKPDTIHEKQTEVLEKIVQEFPYFQSARALYLRGLYNQNSFKYNYALKITAAHTTDRSVLFDFITSDTFTTIQKSLFDKKASQVLNISVIESEVIAEDLRMEVRENSPEQSILTSIKEAELPTVVLEVPKITIDDFVEIAAAPKTENSDDSEPASSVTAAPIEDSVDAQAPANTLGATVEDSSVRVPKLQKAAQKLDIGKPLPFSITERHSFQEWLQLSRIQPIIRDEITATPKPKLTSEVNFEKQKKNVLIDKFIEANPKIPPIKKDSEIPAIFYEPSHADNSSLMTETLARVYLEQKKYQKAIQAYEILILKYPEKSSFFADRILDIKNLQQNNNK